MPTKECLRREEEEEEEEEEEDDIEAVPGGLLGGWLLVVGEWRVVEVVVSEECLWVARS